MNLAFLFSNSNCVFISILFIVLIVIVATFFKNTKESFNNTCPDKCYGWNGEKCDEDVTKCSQITNKFQCKNRYVCNVDFVDGVCEEGNRVGCQWDEGNDVCAPDDNCQGVATGEDESGATGVDESGATGGADESGATGVDESGATGADESGATGGVDESGATGGADESGATGVDESGATGGADESGATGGADESGATGGVDESGATGVDESGATGGADESGATGGVDESGATGADDATGADGADDGGEEGEGVTYETTNLWMCDRWQSATDCARCPGARDEVIREWEDHDGSGCRRFNPKGENTCTTRYIKKNNNDDEYIQCKWVNEECVEDEKCPCVGGCEDDATGADGADGDGANHATGADGADGDGVNHATGADGADGDGANHATQKDLDKRWDMLNLIPKLNVRGVDGHALHVLKNDIEDAETLLRDLQQTEWGDLIFGDCVLDSTRMLSGSGTGGVDREETDAFAKQKWLDHYGETRSWLGEDEPCITKNLRSECSMKYEAGAKGYNWQYGEMKGCLWVEDASLAQSWMNELDDAIVNAKAYLEQQINDATTHTEQLDELIDDLNNTSDLNALTTVIGNAELFVENWAAAAVSTAQLEEAIVNAKARQVQQINDVISELDNAELLINPLTYSITKAKDLQNIISDTNPQFSELQTSIDDAEERKKTLEIIDELVTNQDQIDLLTSKLAGAEDQLLKLEDKGWEAGKCMRGSKFNLDYNEDDLSGSVVCDEQKSKDKCEGYYEDAYAAYECDWVGAGAYDVDWQGLDEARGKKNGEVYAKLKNEIDKAQIQLIALEASHALDDDDIDALQTFFEIDGKGEREKLKGIEESLLTDAADKLIENIVKAYSTDNGIIPDKIEISEAKEAEAQAKAESLIGVAGDMTLDEAHKLRLGKSKFGPSTQRDFSDNVGNCVDVCTSLTQDHMRYSWGSIKNGYKNSKIFEHLSDRGDAPVGFPYCDYKCQNMQKYCCGKDGELCEGDEPNIYLSDRKLCYRPSYENNNSCEEIVEDALGNAETCEFKHPLQQILEPDDTIGTANGHYLAVGVYTKYSDSTAGGESREYCKSDYNSTTNENSCIADEILTIQQHA